MQLLRMLKPLDNAAEVAIIKKLRDQRIDNAEQYRMAGRQDLYDNEMAESLILNEFLPEVPDDKSTCFRTSGSLCITRM